MLQRGFDASFKFYKLNDLSSGKSGIEVGASFALTVPVVTGPINWWKIGGGFDFNTMTNQYAVMLLGDAGPTGTPKETFYLKDDTVKLKFDFDKCAGWPVIEARAKLNIATEDWLSAKMDIDFCRPMFLLAIDGRIPKIPKVDLFAKGVVYVTQQAGKGVLFTALNIQLNALDNLIKGNAFFGVGLNYNNDAPGTPSETKQMWNSISPEAKSGGIFNAIDLNADLSTSFSGGFDIAGGKLLSVSYQAGFNARTKIYYKFTEKTFYGLVAGDFNASMSASIVGIGLSGRVGVNVRAEGGYNTPSYPGKWFANGDAGAYVEFYNNNNVGCNDWNAGWDWSQNCGSIWYPCGCGWFCVTSCYKTVCAGAPYLRFKFCASKNVGFRYVQGSSFSVSL